MSEEKRSESLSSFIDYRKVLYTLVGDLKDLGEYTDDLGLHKSSDLIRETLRRVEDDSFGVAVVGEFKRGKSTFINALLGKNILPSDVLPCSATLNRVTYGLQPSIVVSFKDGTEEQVEIDKLADYVTKLTSESEETALNVAEAVVQYPVPFCQNNVDIIDTPGLNDDDNMTAVTLSVLPKVDAAILVISALSPFGEYERDFLENKVLTSDLGRVIFVVNHIDRLNSPEDVDRIVEHIEERIQRYVMMRAQDRYGEDSAEYEVYLKKIGKPRVFGLSAFEALKGKEGNDVGLLEKSRFPAFESALERFLTEEKGAIFLQVPTNRIIASSGEILAAIDRHESALGMQEGDFQEAFENAEKEINALRARQKDELRLIDQAASQLKVCVEPLVDGIADALMNAAKEVVDSASISGSDLKNNDVLTQRLSRDVSAAVQHAGQKEAEKIQAEIERGVIDEIGRLQDFTAAVARTLDRVQVEFTGVKAETTEGHTAGDTVAAAVAVYTGFGGIWSGYREAGAKGAAIGAAASIGTCFAGGFALAMLSLPVTWPALVALSVVSVFTGGWLTKAVFGGERIERFKESFIDGVGTAITEQLAEADTLKTVREHVDTTFASLKGKLTAEVETKLDDLQETINELREKRSRQEVLTEEERKDLTEMRTKVEGILGSASRLSTELVQICNV